jgi:hypothetical protein
MYTMIATLDHLKLNLNNTYMTLMMVAPMAIVMVLSMSSMFTWRTANIAIVAAAVLVFGASFAAMRWQAAIGGVPEIDDSSPLRGHLDVPRGRADGSGDRQALRRHRARTSQGD